LRYAAAKGSSYRLVVPELCSDPNKPQIVVRRIAQYFNIFRQQQYAYQQFLAVFAGVISV
jgi:hypothetical protein